MQQEEKGLMRLERDEDARGEDFCSANILSLYYSSRGAM